MARKKYRTVNQPINTQNIKPQTNPNVNGNIAKLGLQPYSTEKYFKRDIIGTLITAGIVIVVGAILYYIFK